MYLLLQISKWWSRNQSEFWGLGIGNRREGFKIFDSLERSHLYLENL